MSGRRGSLSLTMSQQSAGQYLRHGQTPFFRTQCADVSQQGPAAYQGAQAVLLGVPWDASVTYRPGARFAPYELRRVSATIQGYHPEHQLAVFERLKVMDGGNVAVPPFNAAACRELLQAEVSHILEAGATPILVGGDHSITLPALRAMAQTHGPLSVVHIDAHLDTSSAEVWGEAHHHGTAFRHALEEGLIAREQLFQVGIRATWGNKEEGQFADSYGARRYDMPAVEDRGIKSLAQEIVEQTQGRPMYLSLDIDGVDPAFAPGTGTPVAGGLTSREIIRFVRSLAGVQLVGMDLVEICPAMDQADITAQLGVQLLFESLALVALGTPRF